MARTSAKTTSRTRSGKRWKSIAINALSVIFAVGLFSLLGFSNRNRSERPIRQLDVQLVSPSGKDFLDSTAVRQLVFKKSPELIGTPSGQLDLGIIHGEVASHPSVRQAQVYLTLDGRCVVRVHQRTPIARILNRDGSGFYLDEDGFCMPLSRHNSAHVPVFTGRIQESPTDLPVPVLAENREWAASSLLDEVFALTQFLRKHEFLKAQTEHILFNEHGEMEIIPRVGNHRILIGDATGLEVKFRKLMAFYSQTLHTRDLNAYSRINLKFENQVVCEKH